MAISGDESILNDFLIEAGEIVDKLGEQLVGLERAPEDRELLNAIFRGFHTVKGGAGFLNLGAIVELCHTAEEVFDILRSGRRGVDPALMDAVMQAVDALTGMMAQLRNGEEPQAAPPALLDRLQKVLLAPASAPKPAPKPAPTPVAQPAAATAAASEDISDDEFEALLDELHGQGKAPVGEPVKQAAAADEISDNEFETLLDELHGSGKPPGAQPLPEAAPPAAEAKAPVKREVQQETTVRVDTQRLDRIMNLVGELVLVRNRLKTLRARARDEELERALSNLDLVTTGLQGAVMQVRMQKVARLFARFPKIARDVARQLGKQVDLRLEGEDTDLDKNLVEALADPLVHLVRNAIDHGLESPEERTRRGKPPTGVLVLAAQQEGDQILITVRDDGAGMDPETIRGKAVEKRVIQPQAAARLSAKECLELIFLPGFSTKSGVSDISGRGVGMDVVKQRVLELKGGVSIDSRIGFGSSIRIRVPLTLAILPTLMARVDGRVYAMPLAAVLDIFSFDPERAYTLEGLPVLALRSSTLPLFDLRRFMSSRVDPPTSNNLVVVAQVEGERCGFIVDEVLGREEVVIKPLGAGLRGLAGFAGATVTGDGRVALILDLSELFKTRGAPPK